MVILFSAVCGTPLESRAKGRSGVTAVDAAYVICALSKAAYNYEF